MKKPQQASADDVLELSVAVIEFYFRIEALTEATAGFATAGGEWGVLRTLVKDGPMTVPEMARSRPVSRQHCQMLTNTLEAQGLVEFIDNPKHKTSKLVRPTKKGRARFQSMRKQFLAGRRRLRAAVYEHGNRHRDGCVPACTRYDRTLMR